MKTRLLIIAFLLFTSLGYACTCIAKTKLKHDIKNASALVSGRVIAERILIEDAPEVEEQFRFRQREYSILIETLYKGKIESDTLKIVTGLGGGDCGISMKIGERYIIYAHYSVGGSLFKDEEFYYTTNICTRTGVYNKGHDRKIRRHKRLLNKIK